MTVSETESYRESDTTEPGHDVVIVDTPVGKLGLTVCYDIRFAGLYTELLNRGAEILAIPSAFTVKTGEAHWQLMCRARAVENFCYVVGSAQGGTHASGRQTYGHSLIVEPWGTVVQEQLLPGDGVVYADVDLEKLHKKYGIHPGFEGGEAESFVLDCPLFKKKIEIKDFKKIWDAKTSSGYLEVKTATLIDKN